MLMALLADKLLIWDDLPVNMPHDRKKVSDLHAHDKTQLGSSSQADIQSRTQCKIAESLRCNSNVISGESAWLKNIKCTCMHLLMLFC